MTLKIDVMKGSQVRERYDILSDLYDKSGVAVWRDDAGYDDNGWDACRELADELLELTGSQEHSLLTLNVVKPISLSEDLSLEGYELIVDHLRYRDPDWDERTRTGFSVFPESIILDYHGIISLVSKDRKIEIESELLHVAPIANVSIFSQGDERKMKELKDVAPERRGIRPPFFGYLDRLEEDRFEPYVLMKNKRPTTDESWKGDFERAWKNLDELSVEAERERVILCKDYLPRIKRLAMQIIMESIIEKIDSGCRSDIFQRKLSEGLQKHIGVPLGLHVKSEMCNSGMLTEYRVEWTRGERDLFTCIANDSEELRKEYMR